MMSESHDESRDERHDSIDPNTGTLTEEAVTLRAERAAAEGSEDTADGDEGADEPVEETPVAEVENPLA